MTISPLRVRLTSSPDLPLPGDRVTVVLTVSNAGAAAVTGATPRLAVVSGSLFLGTLAGPVPPAANLAPGGAQAFTWTASVTAPGEVVVGARLSGTLAGQAALVSAAAVRALTAPAVARLASSLSPEPVAFNAGQWFGVVVTVSNTGGVRAAGVRPRIQPVGEAKLVAFERGPVPGKPQALAPGESARFTFTYSANGSGTVTFSVTVEGRADLSGPGLLSRAWAGAAVTGAAAAEEVAADSRTALARAGAWLFPKPPPEGAEVPFLDFESPDDLLWETAGSARLDASPEHATGGRTALRATFLVPGDLTVSHTGTFRPSLKRTAPARGLAPALAPADWTRFTALRADCYSAAAGPLELRLALADRRGYAWEGMRVLPSRSATTVEFDLAGPRDARLDLSRLASLELSVDTTSLAERPQVWFDRLRFALPPAPASSTPLRASSTTLTGR